MITIIIQIAYSTQHGDMQRTGGLVRGSPVTKLQDLCRLQQVPGLSFSSCSLYPCGLFQLLSQRTGNSSKGKHHKLSFCLLKYLSPALLSDFKVESSFEIVGNFEIGVQGLRPSESWPQCFGSQLVLTELFLLKRSFFSRH